ncbi:DUF6035 family protein [Comamonas suwonensis]|uniref:Competence protein CoiA n=1 Tax=Comamonas suwonensis TaxID=2606214 RepID=A0A843B9J9_9BURK|nr:DUF6035 family protein [Comamonas suwonensis]MBI1625770.1 hypothetical protein [Comamonas suwonensis]
MSYAVKDPKISVVMDMLNGSVVSANQAIGSKYDAAIRLRTELYESVASGAPKYTCPLCGVGLYLNCMHFERKFYFKHSTENEGCPIQTRNLLSQEQIDAIRYNGAKESQLHKQMKEWIRQCLVADNKFSEVVVEGRWKGRLTSEYRRPDIRATYRGLPVAFEVQLSSTYLNVIAERRMFYQQEGALLFWIFANFDEGMRKLTQDDVFYNNNQNAFLVNAETVRASGERGQFVLKCIWREPLTGQEVSDLQQQLIGFDQLTLSQAKQQSYFYDFYGEREKIMRAEAASLYIIEQQRIAEYKARQDRRYSEVRANFHHQWCNWVGHSILDLDEWTDLAAEMDELGQFIPEHPGMLPSKIINALFSLKFGYPFGWAYKNLIEVAHIVLPGRDREKMNPYLEHFWTGVRVFQRADDIREDDQSGKWKAKVAQHRALIKQGIKPPVGDSRYHGLIKFIFPELTV